MTEKESPEESAYVCLILLVFSARISLARYNEGTMREGGEFCKGSRAATRHMHAG